MSSKRRPLLPCERYKDVTILADAGFGGRTGTVELYQVRCDHGHELTLTKHVILDRGCPACRKAGVVMPHGTPRSVSGVQFHLAQMSDKQRQGAVALIQRYLAACKRQRVKVEDLQSAWMEAIDLVLRDPEYADTVDASGSDDLRQRTRYTQYSPPKDVRI